MQFSEPHASLGFYHIGALNALNLPWPLVDKVKFLVWEVVKKDKALAFAQVTLSVTKAFLFVVQEDLENLHLENVFLAQKIYEPSTFGLTGKTR